MGVVAQTSLEAWRIIKPDVGRRQKAVLDAMLEDRFYLDFTAMEIARKLRVPRDTVSPRLTELGKKGLIIVEKVRMCRVTGYRAKAWRPAPEVWLKC